MKYTTNDLSKILGVSGNTIRRYDEMGYLAGSRNEDNGYREFFNEDVERLMYVTKYRKEDLSHEQIASLLKSSPEEVVKTLSEKRDEIQKKLRYYEAVDHLLKDDISLMKLARENMGGLLRQDCQPMHFIRYMIRGTLIMDKKRSKLLTDFMNRCPEFYYMYLFEKQDLENGIPFCSSGIGSNTIMTEKYGYDISEDVEFYESRPCILRFVKAPMDAGEQGMETGGPVWYDVYGKVLDYMNENSLKLAGDVMALKIGSFYENGSLMQYQLFHYPIEEK